MTECKQIGFGFARHFSRAVEARFDGGAMTSDGGGLLLREVERRIGLLERVAGCFEDRRRPERVEHTVREMVAQRVYALALGYEDLNDHEELRQDPLLQLMSGKREAEPLAGKSTLNRLELSRDEPDRYKRVGFRQEGFDQLLLDTFVEAQAEAPRAVVLDLDATDLPLHGHQEGRFFHGYYNGYCYLPLYVFAGEHLLCARLREAGQDAAAGCVAEVERIVAGLRAAWPAVAVIVRADSGFCREELMAWCEAHAVDYVLGVARNAVLRRRIEGAMQQAKQQHAATGKPARVFAAFPHRTVSGSWSRARRVVAKAEQIEGKENPRFVVTSLPASAWPAPALYEQLYCARGEMENRIKEQLSLFATRVSAESMRANQLRVNFAAAAYLLVHALRRLGLQGTELARAQATTIRLKLLKIGAEVRTSARRVWLRMAASFPRQALFQQAWTQLQT